jgi:hypothetical protein
MVKSGFPSLIREDNYLRYKKQGGKGQKAKDKDFLEVLPIADCRLPFPDFP